MKVKMLTTRRGALDAYRFFCYKEGGIFNIPNAQALVYIKTGVAEQVIEESDKLTPLKKKKKKVV